MTKARKGLYEGMYILSATLSDESRKKALEKVTEGIAHFGGEIHKVHDWGRRKLAYTIDQRKEGHYYVVYFTVPTAAVIELWKDYNLHEDLIRFSTMIAETVPETLEFKPIRVAS